MKAPGLWSVSLNLFQLVSFRQDKNKVPASRLSLDIVDHTMNEVRLSSFFQTRFFDPNLKGFFIARNLLNCSNVHVNNVFTLVECGIVSEEAFVCF